MTCGQSGETKIDCTQRNVLYESRCASCNVQDSEDKDKNLELQDARPQPSIYVGESSRSMFERCKEHSKDYKDGTTDSHMMKHWDDSHRGEDRPAFNFFKIRQFKDSLSRQVAESVRIELRGNTLNSKGVYNRSKLTRLCVDTEWDRQVWEDAWKTRNEAKERQAWLSKQGEEEFRPVSGVKRQSRVPAPASKRRKVCVPATVWGEEKLAINVNTQRFLYEGGPITLGGTCMQTILTPLLGVQWHARLVVEELVSEVVDFVRRKEEDIQLQLLVDQCEGVDSWEEWGWMDEDCTTCDITEYSECDGSVQNWKNKPTIMPSECVDSMECSVRPVQNCANEENISTHYSYKADRIKQSADKNPDKLFPIFEGRGDGKVSFILPGKTGTSKPRKVKLKTESKLYLQSVTPIKQFLKTAAEKRKAQCDLNNTSEDDNYLTVCKTIISRTTSDNYIPDLQTDATAWGDSRLVKRLKLRNVTNIENEREINQ